MSRGLEQLDVLVGEWTSASEKYSEGPNLSATSASGGAATAMISVATQPAKNEPIAAMASAGPARPWRAIW